MGGRLYLWLVCHDACPCQWRPRTRLMCRFCDWLDRRYFHLDDSVVVADEVELRLEDSL